MAPERAGAALFDRLHPMDTASFAFTALFCALLVLGLVIRTVLASRQIRHVARHRGTVPAAFSDTISVAAHQKAADYTITKTRFGLLEIAIDAALLLGWTLLGGLDWLNQTLLAALGGGMVQQLALLGSFAVIGGLITLPLGWYATFRIEERFGFNKMTTSLWLGDLLKGTLVGALIGLPIAGAGALAHGRGRPGVVALGLGRVDGVQPARAGALPHGDRAAVQQVRAAGTTRPSRPA